MKSSIVLGLGFGDEGKGRTVSALASLNTNNLVVRFSGGHQAGHTVVYDNNRHIFSSFGSATLQGVPTYWSRFCTFYPLAALNELDKLKKAGINPMLYIDPMCPVTTPFDVKKNRDRANFDTVGVGIGTTFERQEKFYRLYFKDLFYERVCEEKLRLIAEYYGNNAGDKAFDRFMGDVFEVTHNSAFRTSIDFNDFSHLIFEGSQGIMLDEDAGFYPNVTWGNTTSKNAVLFLAELGISVDDISVYYVTRPYQTRHGRGYMSNEGVVPNLTPNEKETNVKSPYQGDFRYGILDIDQLQYALKCDHQFVSNNIEKNLVITCLDQITDRFLATYEQEMLEIPVNSSSMLASYMGVPINKTLRSFADSGDVEI